MGLEKELATYRQELGRLLDQEGEFVLIRGGEVAGVFETFQDAVTAGYEKFGLDQFLVRRIQAVERPPFLAQIGVRSEDSRNRIARRGAGRGSSLAPCLWGHICTQRSTQRRQPADQTNLDRRQLLGFHLRQHRPVEDGAGQGVGRKSGAALTPPVIRTLAIRRW